MKSIGSPIPGSNISSNRFCESWIISFTRYADERISLRLLSSEFIMRSTFSSSFSQNLPASLTSLVNAIRSTRCCTFALSLISNTSESWSVSSLRGFIFASITFTLGMLSEV